jgi:hypothetical protein
LGGRAKNKEEADIEKQYHEGIEIYLTSAEKGSCCVQLKYQFQ